MPSAQHSAAIKVAQAHRSHDRERIEQARRELAEKNIESAVKRALAASPPLTRDQCRRLAALLRGGAS